MLWYLDVCFDFSYALAPNDRAGHVVTIIETGMRLKCELALELIAAGYRHLVDTPWL